MRFARNLINGNKAIIMNTQASFAYTGDVSSEIACTGPALELDTILNLPVPWSLESGAVLNELQVAVRMFGPADAPVVVALGGMSAHRTIVTQDPANPGWWQDVLQPLLTGELSNYRVLGLDYVGGYGDSTGPVHWGDMASQFPDIDTADHASVLAAVLDQLGVEQVDSVIGASFGGMVALRFAQDHPHRLRKLMVIGAAHRAPVMASARRHVQRSILELANNSIDEQSVVAIARSLAMTTYRSEQEFEQRFGGEGGVEAMQAYLDHCGERFACRFNRESYIRLSRSIDNHRVNPAEIDTPVAIVGFDQDEICPLGLARQLAATVSGNFRITELRSRYGHDAFLLEHALVRNLVRKFLRGVLV